MNNSPIAREGMLFCLVGPAGSGKSTLGKTLLDACGSSLRLSISVTSRSPRAGEIEGVHYYFVSRAEFEKRVKEGLFFEWEETHGNLYGSLKKTVEDAISGGYDLLLDIDIRGALNFKRAYQRNTVIVFLFAPSEQDLRVRMEKRGKVTEEELNRRLLTAKGEYQKVLEAPQDGTVDYAVLNDKFDDTAVTLKSILEAERCKMIRLSRKDLGRISSIA